MKRPLLTAVLTIATAASALGQTRLGTTWIPASDVLNPDGTLTVEFAATRELPRTGDLTREDDLLALGLRVAERQRRFWEKFGRASDLGLEDGATVVDRKYCLKHDASNLLLRRHLGPRPSWEFGEWASRAEAILEARVSAVSGGFGLFPLTAPVLQVTLSVRRHLFEPEHPFADELHVLMEHGEFVAGDAVFCRLPWGSGGYRPRVGDIWIVGAFVPPSEYWSHSVLHRIGSAQVFVVLDTGELRRGAGGSWPSTDTFPTSLDGFVDRVNAMSLAGELDFSSPWAVAKATREREAYERRIRRWTTERAGREARNLASAARRQCYALVGRSFNENGYPTKPVLEAYLQAMRNCDRPSPTDTVAMSCPNGLLALGVGDPRIGASAVEIRPASTKWVIDGAASWSSQWLVSDGWLFEPDEKDVDRFIRHVRTADRNAEIVFSTIQDGGGAEYEGRVSVQSALDVIDNALGRCTGD